MLIDKTEFWGKNFYHHPLLTVRMVEFAEKSLGVKLPGFLIELLKIQNGGYTKGFAFPMEQRTSWAKDHVPLIEMFGIVIDENFETSQNILLSDYMTQEWGLPEKQILLAGEGHWWITLDYRQSEIPSVRWLDVDCDEDIRIAESFEEFINGLVLGSTYF